MPSIKPSALNKNYILKLKSVLPLFSIVVWSSVFFLGVVRWWLFTGKFPILEVREEMWELYIPAFVAFAPILFWMKFERLTFVKSPRRRVEQLQIIGYFTLFGMLAISQAYLSTLQSKMVLVKDVTQIESMKEARYFRIDIFAVHRMIGGAYYTSRVDGKFQSNLNFDIFFVNPILTHKRQIIARTPRFWFGTKFTKRVSNYLGNQEKQRRFQAFYQECVNKMVKYDFQKVDHFELKPVSYDLDGYRIAVKNAMQRPINNDFMILEGNNKAFENKDSQKIAWTVLTYLIGCGIYMLALIKPGYLKEFSEES
ncbi:hypothetical protein [Dyadobacter alkalitolerans]|uniref:hypothetical protein n=1 Tax=Dyadobacter alkalitolerans TaxID=492736 RepID=UPI0003F6931F|nr:hypothetical protein [Dyadobacter alkalitolerans]